MISKQARQRLENARNLWLATVRPNGSPHLVPIWFVWLDDRAYLCTSIHSVKARNIAKNSRVAFALEDGDNPIVLEGAATILRDIPENVVRAFHEKFNWDIRGDSTYNAVIKIQPQRVVL
jgi:general stress protein 26